MNLLLSLQAARDRLEAHNDDLINLWAEEEIRKSLEALVGQGGERQQLSTELQALHQQVAVRDAVALSNGS